MFPNRFWRFLAGLSIAVIIAVLVLAPGLTSKADTITLINTKLHDAQNRHQSVNIYVSFGSRYYTDWSQVDELGTDYVCVRETNKNQLCIPMQQIVEVEFGTDGTSNQ